MLGEELRRIQKVGRSSSLSLSGVRLTNCRFGGLPFLMNPTSSAAKFAIRKPDPDPQM